MRELAKELAVLCLWAALGTGWVRAQPTSTEMITAGNVRNLRSVSYVDFAALAPQVGEIGNGWFMISPHGDRFGLRSTAGDTLIVSSTGQLVDRFNVVDERRPSQISPWTPIDMAISASQRYVATLYAGESAEIIVWFDTATGENFVFQPGSAEAHTLSLWFDAQDAGLWAEIEQQGEFSVMCFAWRNPQCSHAVVTETPQDDDEAAVRLGRIHPPFAVTATSAGVFRLWNLQMGGIVSEALGGALPDIGNLDPSGRYLAWHDPVTGDVHVLDFETGEDKRVAPAGEGYVQAIFVANQGDVIMAVDIDFRPIVVAWDVRTGERILLGEYRACDRSPDAIRMSRDGTTIAIGCGSEGIDIWQVQEATR